MKTNEYFLLFLSPLFAFLSQFDAILIALTLLVLINYVTSVLVAQKALKGFFVFRFAKATFDKSVIDKFFKKTIEYPLSLASIALFETYFIGGAYIEFMDGNITLSKMALILVGWRELRFIFNNIQELTGNDVLTTLEGFLPEKLKALAKTKSPQ